MKFSNVLILAIVLGGGYSYFFPKKEPQTINEKLIAQFDKQDVIKRNDWEKGNIIDGVQIFSVRKDYSVFQSVWALGKDEASVMVLTEGKTPKIEAAFALSQCNQLAKSVADSDDSTVHDAVFSIFQNALATDKDKNGILRATGNVDGKSYDISVRTIGSTVTFGCGIRTT